MLLLTQQDAYAHARLPPEQNVKAVTSWIMLCVADNDVNYTLITSQLADKKKS
jgi:hypothetical protein